MKTTRDTVAEVMGKMAAEAGEEIPAEPEIEAGAADEPVEPAPVEEIESKGERQRGPDGKFAKVDPQEQASGAAAEGGTSRQAPPKPEAPAGAIPKPDAPPPLKPPADWTPKAKEEWAKVPRVAQEEAHRLHAEVQKTLRESANARQVADAFQRTVAPYEHMFRASGRSPVEGVGWLVQQYAQLQTAPIPQRAAIVAGLVRDFIGVDEASINLLAAALEGKPGAAAASGPAALRPDQVQQMIREEAKRMAGESQGQAELKAIQDFEASAPEFIGNLTNEIGALVAIEKRQGKPITVEMLKQVYERAARINTETAAILKQRDDAAAAVKKSADDKKKQAAATGIKNEPAGPAGSAKASSTRDEVRKQMERLSRGGTRV